MEQKKKNFGILKLMSSPCIKCNPKKEDCYKWPTCWKRKFWCKLYKIFGDLL